MVPANPAVTANAMRTTICNLAARRNERADLVLGFTRPVNIFGQTGKFVEGDASRRALDTRSRFDRSSSESDVANSRGTANSANISRRSSAANTGLSSNYDETGVIQDLKPHPSPRGR